jgi:enoyl-CoA hydratase
MHKMVLNQVADAAGLMNTQQLATIFDGIARHSPAGLAFKARAEEAGFAQAVAERDSGEPIPER